MNIIDLTDAYLRHVIGAGQRERYEESYPEIFDHYFKYWADRDSPMAVLSADDVHRQRDLLLRYLAALEGDLAAAGFDIAGMEVILFVGHNTSNGHACRVGDRFVVWIPIESYVSEGMAGVFLTYEIAHALHYTATPSFYFSNHDQKEALARQLITEGMAMWFTREILHVADMQALWADYLTDEQAQQWLKLCRDNEDALYAFCRERFADDAPAGHLFHLANMNDVFANRAGYYVGLKIIDEIAAEYRLGLLEMISMDRDRLQALVLDKLRRDKP